MRAKPVSVSLTDEMEAMVRQRAKQQRMSVSEYFRKCVREEVERAKVRRLMMLNPALIN